MVGKGGVCLDLHPVVSHSRCPPPIWPTWFVSSLGSWNGWLKVLGQCAKTLCFVTPFMEFLDVRVTMYKTSYRFKFHGRMLEGMSI